MHAEKIAFLLAIALIVTNVAWWVRVRGLNGVVSDLKNVKSDAQDLKNKVGAGIGSLSDRAGK